MSWPESHLETEDGESSVGDRGECTLVHAGALYCRLYNVNGKFYYFSNTSPMNLHSYNSNKYSIYTREKNKIQENT